MIGVLQPRAQDSFAFEPRSPIACPRPKAASSCRLPRAATIGAARNSCAASTVSASSSLRSTGTCRIRRRRLAGDRQPKHVLCHNMPGRSQNSEPHLPNRLFQARWTASRKIYRRYTDGAWFKGCGRLPACCPSDREDRRHTSWVHKRDADPAGLRRCRHVPLPLHGTRPPRTGCRRRSRSSRHSLASPARRRMAHIPTG